MKKQQTRWEERERAGLLALETEEWREKRALAEDPTTPAETLARLTTAAFFFGQNANYDAGGNRINDKAEALCLEAAATHPNTPPQLLARLFDHVPRTAAAVCRNPVLPFLLLEQPDFLANLSQSAQYLFLKNADAPPHFVRLLTGKESGMARHRFVQVTARLHTAYFVESLSAKGAARLITIYWRGVCGGYVKGDYGNGEGDKRDWLIDLVEVGLAPIWASGKAPREPSYTLPFIDPLAAWFRWTPAPGSREEREFLRRIDPQLRNWKLLTRALRLSAAPGDLRDLLRDPAYNTFDISDIMKRAVMLHPSITGDLLKEIVEKALKYEPEMACHSKSPPDLIARLLQSKVALVRRLARRHPNAPAEAVEIAREAALQWARQGKHDIPWFASFVAAIQEPQDTADLTRRAESGIWTRRLEAALLASATDAPLAYDPYGRTGLDLLHHLAQDGNRLVRSVAQTRLADPNWIFAWHEGE